MVAAPERDAVELHPQAGGAEAGNEQLIPAELLAGPHGERVLPGRAGPPASDRGLRRRLLRHQQPLVCLGQARGHRAVGASLAASRPAAPGAGSRLSASFSSRIDSHAR